jgi:hypothetical protein
VSSFVNCAQIQPPARERRLCLTQPVADRAPPGRLIWINPTARRLPGGAVSEANDKLMTDFAVRAMTAQPFGYFDAIASGVRRAVDWRRGPYPGAYTVSQYRLPYRPEALPANRSWIPGGTALADARSFGRASPSRVVRPFSSLIRAYQGHVFSYGPAHGRCAGACHSDGPQAHETLST